MPQIPVTGGISSSTTQTSTQVMDFIHDDDTDLNVWKTNYRCLSFSMDLAAKAKRKGIDSWIVVAFFVDREEGHAFVAFPTVDRDVIWVEPQTDDTFRAPEVGKPLCLADSPNWCMASGVVSTIMQPIYCNELILACWQRNQ